MSNIDIILKIIFQIYIYIYIYSNCSTTVPEQIITASISGNFSGMLRNFIVS